MGLESAIKALQQKSEPKQKPSKPKRDESLTNEFKGIMVYLGFSAESNCQWVKRNGNLMVMVVMTNKNHFKLIVNKGKDNERALVSDIENIKRLIELINVFI